MSEAIGSRASDDAADAARFLSRVGYIVLAVGAPTGVLLHPLAIFVMFPIGVALLLFGALLEGGARITPRFSHAFSIPAVIVVVSGLAWAAISILWAPYPVAAGQHALKLALLMAATVLALVTTRAHARATDLYLFPIGVLAAMAGMLALGLSTALTGAPHIARIAAGGVAIAVLIFPAVGGLAARGRNGLARVLLILALAYAFALGDSPLTIGLFVGYLTLSFALSDPERTYREASILAAAAIVLSPLVPALAPTIATWVFHAKLSALPSPYDSLSVAADIFTHDKARLITGHGFETVSRSVASGILPKETPRSFLFAVWYELGIVGALLSAAGAWLAFRSLLKAPARLSPYLAAALACNIALAFLSVDYVDMTWMTLVSVSAISADMAARSLYRTTRPSIASAALL